MAELHVDDDNDYILIEIVSRRRDDGAWTAGFALRAGGPSGDDATDANDMRDWLLEVLDSLPSNGPKTHRPSRPTRFDTINRDTWPEDRQRVLVLGRWGGWVINEFYAAAPGMDGCPGWRPDGADGWFGAEHGEMWLPLPNSDPTDG